MTNRIDIKRAREVCRIDAGEKRCRYLAGTPKGLACLKHTELRIELDLRASLRIMVAQSDNCEGLHEEEHA
jgi:hypothetical protein